MGFAVSVVSPERVFATLVFFLLPRLHWGRILKRTESPRVAQQGEIQRLAVQRPVLPVSKTHTQKRVCRTRPCERTVAIETKMSAHSAVMKNVINTRRPTHETEVIIEFYLRPQCVFKTETRCGV